MSEPAQIILVLHPPNIDPYPFLARLTEAPSPISEEPVELPWTIDNKYYTTNVTFQILEVGEDDPVQARDIPIVMYLFNESCIKVPATLVKVLMTEPRDIALAVKLKQAETTMMAEGAQDDLRVLARQNLLSKEDVEEMFEEVGCEVVDETTIPEEDDERPMEPIDTIRQTLMTHMWPNMIRKSLRQRGASELPLEVEDKPQLRRSSSSHGGSPEPAEFPISFAASPQALRSTEAGPSKPRTHAAKDGAFNAPALGVSGDFPGLDELRSQVAQNAAGDDDFVELVGLHRVPDRSQALDATGIGEDDDFVELVGMHAAPGRLRAMEDVIFGESNDGPDMGEYTRLDEWLDEDEVQDGNGLNGGGASYLEKVDDFEDFEVFQNPQAVGRNEDERDVSQRVNGENGRNTGEETIEAQRNDTFEDDFDEFTAFHAAPAANARREAENEYLSTLDPTPLLLHLQSVRETLAGVADEDERRVRAGREVARVMRDLGMGDDFDLEDFDEPDDDPDQPRIDGLPAIVR